LIENPIIEGKLGRPRCG